MKPHSDLGYWAVLDAVVSHGGYAAAAQALHRSQSSVSYAIARLQEQVGVALLEPQGRRMVLTATGSTLLDEARALLRGMERLERRATSLGRGWEAEVRIAVDSVFPLPVLLDGLRRFAAARPDTRVQMHETVLSGTDEALLGGEVELAVTGRVPPGFLGDWVLDVEFVAVAHPAHPLHAQGRPLNTEDLAQHLQVVVRDSGRRAPRDAGWLGAHQRWTVGSAETSAQVVAAGLAYAWLPRHVVAGLIAEGALRPLPLASGQIYRVGMHLVLADPAAAGPATRLLAAQLAQAVAAARGD